MANLIINVIEQNIITYVRAAIGVLATNLSQGQNQPGLRLSQKASKCVMGFLVRASKPFECFKGGFFIRASLYMCQGFVR